MNTNDVKWVMTHYCDMCGRSSQIALPMRETTAHFNVGYDWEDSITNCECLPCLIKHSIKRVYYNSKSWCKHMHSIIRHTTSNFGYKIPLKNRIKLFADLYHYTIMKGK